MDVHSRIYIAGHRGLVGSAMKRQLEKRGYTNLVYQSSKELDLRDRSQVDRFFAGEKPEYVILSAAKVGGIHANHTYPAEFMYDNLAIQLNVIDAAYRHHVKKLLFLGSSCIYPKFAPQPMKEEYLLTGGLEPTNEPYAVAKIAGMKMCEAYNRQYGTNFLSVMPTNLYGPCDNFDLETSHVLPALLRKFHHAKLHDLPFVEIWGTGKPRREFLYVDDLADACLYLMNHFPSSDVYPFVNIGTGKDLEIAELACMIQRIVGYSGDLRFNADKPDGTPVKWLDVSKLEGLGWKASTTLEEGIKKTYEWLAEYWHAVER